MTNFMFIIIVAIVLIALILFFTPFGKQLRVKFKGRTDEVMRQDAQTPEGARDYYNAAIREKEDFYNKASATYAEISGKRDTAEKDLYQANKDIMRVTQQINACLDENKENEAMQYAMKKSTLENKINVLKDTIEEMKEAQVHKLLSEAVDGELNFEGIIGSPCQEAYRNKMEFSFGDEVKGGELALGLHKRNSMYDICLLYTSPSPRDTR